MSVEIEALTGLKHRQDKYSCLAEMRRVQTEEFPTTFGNSLFENVRIAKRLRRADRSKVRIGAKIDALEGTIQAEKGKIEPALAKLDTLSAEGYYPRDIYESERRAYEQIFPPPPEPQGFPIPDSQLAIIETAQSTGHEEASEEKYKRFTLRKVPPGELQFAYEVLRGEHEKEWSRPKRPIKTKPLGPVKEESRSINFKEAARILKRLSVTDTTPDHSAILSVIQHINTEVLERLIPPAQR